MALSVPQPKVRNAPVKAVFQQQTGNSAAFGSGVAKAAAGVGASLQGASNDAARIALDLQGNENTRLAKDADNNYARLRRNILHGDGKTPGYYGKTGVDGVDAYNPSVKALEDARQQVSEGMKNPTARRMFDLNSKAGVEKDLDGMTTTLNNNRRTAQITTSNTRIAEASEDVRAVPHDLGTVAKSLGIVRAETMSQAQLQGWSQETLNSEMEKAVTAMYSGMVTDERKRGNISSSVALLEKYKGQMDPQVAAQLTEDLARPKEIEESLIKADTYLAMTGLTDPEQLALARKETKGQERIDVVKEITRQQSEKAAVSKKVARKDAAALATELSKGTTTLNDADKTGRFGAILADAGIVGLRGTLEKIEQQRNQNDGFAVTETAATRAKLAEFSQMSAKEQADANMTLWAPHLTRGGWSAASKMQTNSKQLIEETAEQPTGHTEAQKILRSQTSDFDWGKKNKKGELDQDKRAQPMANDINDFVSTYTKNHPGKEPPHNEVMAEITRLKLEVTDPFGFFSLGQGFDVNVSQAIPASGELTTDDNLTVQQQEIAIVELANIPADMKGDITQALIDNNIPVTQENIENMAGARAFKNKGREETILNPKNTASQAIPTTPTPAPAPAVVAIPEDEGLQTVDIARGKGTSVSKNNNPGNIRRTNIAWDGKVESDGEFEKFSTPEFGVRALGKNLMTYETQGNNTISKIINKWAPPHENPTQNYIDFVSKRTGFDADEVVSAQDQGTLLKLTDAIIAFEGGKDFDKGTIVAGIDMLFEGAKVEGGEGDDDLFQNVALTNEQKEQMSKVFGPVIKEGHSNTGEAPNTQDQGTVPSLESLLPPIQRGRNQFGLSVTDFLRGGGNVETLKQEWDNGRDFGSLPTEVFDKLVMDRSIELDKSDQTVEDLLTMLLEMEIEPQELIEMYKDDEKWVEEFNGFTTTKVPMTIEQQFREHLATYIAIIETGKKQGHVRDQQEV